MSRRWKIRIITLIVAAFAVVTAFAGVGWYRVAQYGRANELNSRRAFADLCEAVSSIDTDLSKAVYASSPGLIVSLANNISRNAEIAKAALGALPYSDTSFDRTGVFLSQVGNFSVSVARKAAGGERVPDEDLASLKNLSRTASDISVQLNDLFARSGAKDFYSVSASKTLRRAEEKAETPLLAQGLSSLEESMPESPVLIYDGPYSSHITQRVPEYLEAGGGQISEAEARKKAAEFLELPENSLKAGPKTEGDEIIYSFSFEETGTYISVTAVGGHIMSFSQGATPGEAKISPRDAVEKGAEFLKSRGIGNMTSSYFYVSGGVCYINYHYTDGEVLIYPDLLQLGVDLSSGDVTYMQAAGYLNNKKSGRDLNASLNIGTAEEFLADGLTPEDDGKLCVIPSSGENELLCYEFLCKGGDDKSYLVYINAKTGVCESIFVLITDENGTLTV